MMVLAAKTDAALSLILDTMIFAYTDLTYNVK